MAIDDGSIFEILFSIYLIFGDSDCFSKFDLKTYCRNVLPVTLAVSLLGVN